LPGDGAHGLNGLLLPLFDLSSQRLIDFFLLLLGLSSHGLDGIRLLFGLSSQRLNGPFLLFYLPSHGSHGFIFFGGLLPPHKGQLIIL
jgi:hypothetical protein